MALSPRLRTDLRSFLPSLSFHPRIGLGNFLCRKPAQDVRPIRPTRSTTLGLDLGPQSFLFQWELPVSGDGHRLSQILTAWASSYFLPMLKSDRKRRRGRGHSKRKKDTEEALDSIKRRFFLPSLFQK